MLPLALLLALLLDSPVAVDGTVRDAVSGQPVAGARVELRGKRGFHVAASDSAGVVRFQDLPPGDYMLTAEKPGYVSPDYSGVKPQPVRILPSPDRQHLAVRMTPAATLTGRLLGEDREPLGGATVSAGLRGSTFERSASVDAGGWFRLEGLAPGKQQFRITVPLEVRRRFVRSDPRTGELWSYTFLQKYPKLVAAPAGVTTYRDLALRRTRLATLAGRVVDATFRQPVLSVSAELDLPGGYSESAFLRHALDAKGGFRFELIEPRPSRVLLYRLDTFPFAVTLKPTAEPLQVLLPEFATLEASVCWPEGTAELPEAVQLSFVPPFDGVPERTFTIPARACAVISEIPPGTYRLRTRLLGHKDWYVAGIRFGTADAAASAITVTDSGNGPLVIHVAAGGGRIQGRVAQPDRHTALTIAPSGQLLPVRPDGSFTIDGLAPGRHSLHLVRTNRIDCSTDHATVDVKRGATSTVQLEACR